MAEKFKEIPEIPKVNNIPEPGIENIESSKLEWGPELGPMSWYDAQKKIIKLNKSLPEGEKPWRLPTENELVAEFNKTGETPNGFKKDCYWSVLPHLDGSNDGTNVNMGYGHASDYNTDSSGYLVRCVR